MNPLVQRFIDIVTDWNNPGWGEYLLWETLEGRREKPFPSMDPLSAEDLEVLRRLRDDEKVWPSWNGVGWELAGIEEWRAHAATTSSKDVRDAMGGT